MDLATLISSFNKNSAQAQETIAGLKSTYGAAIAATGDAANQIQRAGQAAATIKSQEAKGELEAQENARRMATANGTNLSADNEILTLLGQRQREQALDVSERASRVDQITQAANIGNPFGMLFDIFYGDSERAALESGQRELESTTQSIQALNQSTQTTALTQKAIAQTQTDATVAATEELALAQAAEAVAEKKVRMATLNADMLSQVNSLNNQQLSNAMRIWQAEESAEQRAFMRAQREEALALRKAEKESMDEIIRYYNEGAKVLNIAPIANAREFETRRKMGKDAQDRMDLAIQKGFEVLQTGKLSFGNTPIEALGVKQQYNISVPPIQQPVFNKMEQWIQEFSANPGQSLIDLGLSDSKTAGAENMKYQKLKPAEQAEVMNQVLNARYLRDYENLRLGDPTNIAALPPIDILQGSTLLDSNPFVEKYIKPDVVAGGGIAYDPGKYIQMAEEALMSGELTTAQVAEGLSGISKSLYTQGVLSKGFTSAFGLPAINQYPVVVESGSSGPMFGAGMIPGTTNKFSSKIDILDAAEWNKYLSDYMRKRVSSGVLGRFSLF